MGKRIVLTTFGSLGDLHPYIALAKGLQARGHTPVLATTEFYRPNIEAEGIPFHPVRPDTTQWLQDPELFRKVMDVKDGTEFLLRELVMPTLQETYEDLQEALSGADLLLTHPLSLSALVVAEERKMKWLSLVLAPASFLSAHDFPLTASLPAVSLLRRMGPFATRAMLAKARQIMKPIVEPYHRFRVEKGLPSGENPFLGGQFSPHKTLALYSPLMGGIQPDYPPNTVLTGFLYHDKYCAEEMPEELEAFLQAGSPPLVFTLGSAASMTAGNFYEQSIDVARRANRRAVLLIGRDPKNRPKQPLGDRIIAVEYAPYSELFSRSAALITSGGIGTIGQILRAGKPAIIIPHGHDQWDNGDRLRRLGVGRVVQQKQYTTLHGAAEILRLVGENLYPAKAKEVAEKIAQENGLERACREIESVLS